MEDNLLQGLQVIKASAGSGKTYTLALRYIEQLLFRVNRRGKLELRKEPGYHQHILAITFTNKATNEMKSRIIKQLYVLSCNPKDSEYYDELQRCCEPEAFEGLQQAAHKALSDILFDYSQFNVRTIDTFFQSILRSFARELDRDYNYDLQIDAKYAMSVAVHKFLLSLGKDAARTGGKMTQVERWVKEYMKEQLQGSKSWSSMFNDEGALFNAAENINKEFFRNQLPALRSFLTDEKGNSNLEGIVSFKKLLLESAEQLQKQYEETDWSLKLADILRADNLDLSNVSGTMSLSKYILKFRGQEPSEKVLALVSSCGEDQFKKNSNPSADVLDKISELVRDMCSLYYECELLKDMASRLSLVGLIGEIDKKLEEYRRESNTILIADTNELIGKVVENSGGAPFIYERTGTWINHYMLDEFQDTSSKQYENFKPLLDESLSHGTDNFNLIIGDSKQAIYRFRNADPSLFRDRINVDFSGLQSTTLQHNWRSQKNIIEFNNGFFEKLLEQDEYRNKGALMRTFKPNSDDKDYKQLVPKRQQDPAGMVRVLFELPNAEADGGVKTIEKVEEVAAIMPQYLLKLHERFEWKDINILVDRNKSQGRVIVEAILQHNMQARAEGRDKDVISIVSGEMMQLGKSVAVRRIISLLRFIDLTNYVMSEDDDARIDDTAKLRASKRNMSAQRQFTVLSRFIAGLEDVPEATDEQAGSILNSSFDAVDKTIGQKAETQIQEYAQLLRELLPDTRTQLMSLVNIVEHIIDSQLGAREKREEVIYLHAFVNCVMAFAAQRSNGGTVREFLRYWDMKGDSLAVPSSDSANAISIYTIHKSKGLEADCVVLPYAAWEMNGDGMTKEYWMDATTWLDGGGSEILKKALGADVDKDKMLPIFSASKKTLQNLAKLGKFTSFVNKTEEDILIDHVNKTYVAFTRPRKELHIFASGKGICKDMSTIVPQLEGFRPVPVENLTGDDAPSKAVMYQLGEPFVAPAKAEKKDDCLVKPLPPYAVSSNTIEVSLPNDETSMREVGKRVHTLLSRINFRRDCDQAISYCLRRGIITDEPDDKWNVGRIRTMVETMFDTKPMSEWFADDNTILNERSILTQDEHGEFSLKRPDRVVMRPDGRVIVVDYKSGMNQTKGHVRQVQDYMVALRATGFAQVEGYLWYIATNDVIPVTL